MQPLRLINNPRERQIQSASPAKLSSAPALSDHNLLVRIEAMAPIATARVGSPKSEIKPDADLFHAREPFNHPGKAIQTGDGRQEEGFLRIAPYGIDVKLLQPARKLSIEGTAEIIDSFVWTAKRHLQKMNRLWSASHSQGPWVSIVAEAAESAG
jgi:hypothetical protein